MITYDEPKRKANISIHGFDFIGSESVFAGLRSRVKTGVMLTANCACKRWGFLMAWWSSSCTHRAATLTTSFQSERQKSMKNASTGKTSRIDADSPRTKVADWEGAVLKQGGVEVGRARTRGPNTQPLKEQVAVRYSPDVLAAFRATGAGCGKRA